MDFRHGRVYTRQTKNNLPDLYTDLHDGKWISKLSKISGLNEIIAEVRAPRVPIHVPTLNAIKM